jgi:putative ABC transport system substrate-binding protein
MTAQGQGRTERRLAAILATGIGRREFIALLAGTVAGSSVGRAQKAKVYRIGFLFAGTLALRPQAREFWHTLQELGYEQGRNLEIETREARGEIERLPALASELVATNPDLIVAVTTPAVAAVKEATKTIPIVMAVVTDPVGSRFVKSLSRPETNITGPGAYLGDLTGKRMQLLRQLLPNVTILGMLWNERNSLNLRTAELASEVARTMGFSLKSLPLQTPAELTPLLDSSSKEHLDGIFVLGDSLMFDRRTEIVEFSIANRIPTFHTWPEEAIDGAFAAYGSRLSDEFRRTAYYVDKILRGASASELPVDQPTKFEFVINLKTAKSIGISISPAILLTADEVIE